MPKPSSIRPVSVQNLIVNMCLTAESGFGKSVFAGSAPNALILSADPEGTDSIAFSGQKADEWPIRSYSELDESYRYFRDGSGCKDYEWLIVDSIPEVQKIMMRNALNIAVSNNAKRDPDIPAQADYQKIQIQLLEYVKRLNELPIHVLYTAHPAEYTDGEGEVYYLPAVHGASGDIARSFIGYMKINTFGEHVDKKVAGQDELKRVRRYWMTNHGPYKAKDRYFGAMGNYKDDLTIPKMMELIKAKAAAGSKPAPATTRRTATTRRRRATS